MLIGCPSIFVFDRKEVWLLKVRNKEFKNCFEAELVTHILLH